MAINYGSKRLVVGAHYGLRDWLIQRVTGALMALFTIALLPSMSAAGLKTNVGESVWTTNNALAAPGESDGIRKLNPMTSPLALRLMDMGAKPPTGVVEL